jgi:hypothetical protein
MRHRDQVWPFTYLSNSFYCSNDHTLIRTNNFDNMYSNANNNNGVFTRYESHAIVLPPVS